MNTTEASPCPTLTLEAKTAADLMTPNVVSIPLTATLTEAVAVLRERRITAAPVCDELGNGVGVFGRSDLVAHDPEQFELLQPELEKYKKIGLVVRLRRSLSQVFQSKKVGPRRVKELMTPVVFSVAADTPACTVIDAMLLLAVHRIFVTQSDGKIVGVISATDVIRHLHAPGVSEAVPVEEAAVGLCL